MGVAGGPSAFEVKVVIDGDEDTPDVQPAPDGLFSYGWDLTFNAVKATADTVTVEPQLDFLGFAPGAQVTTGPGAARAKGTIEQVAPIVTTINVDGQGQPTVDSGTDITVAGFQPVNYVNVEIIDLVNTAGGAGTESAASSGRVPAPAARPHTRRPHTRRPLDPAPGPRYRPRSFRRPKRSEPVGFGVRQPGAALDFFLDVGRIENPFY